MKAIIAELAEEYESLDSLVVSLDSQAWHWPTPAMGWSIGDQIRHLAAGEIVAAHALKEGAISNSTRDARFIPGSAEWPRSTILAQWRRHRDEVLRLLDECPPQRRIPWVAGTMSPASFATARMMETWAHGHDVAEAAGLPRTPTPRLRHIARLGVVTRNFSFRARGLTPPLQDVIVELHGSGSDVWRWGPRGSPHVQGPALDFCLVVTQRRRLNQTALVVSDRETRFWLAIAQVFAGGPSVSGG